MVAYIRMLQGAGTASWAGAILGAMPFWYLWALLSPGVWWLGRQFPIEGRAAWRNVIAHALLAGGIATIHVIATLAVFRSPLYPTPVSSVLDAFRGFAGAYFPFEYLLYWAVLGAGYLLDYHDRYRSGSIRTAQLEAQLAQAHLQALRVQLQPHFLFNTLHSISSLMDEDLETARRMLVRLGDLLRLTLETQRIHEVPLREELECVEMYLDIERVRFPEQLDVEMLVEPEALDTLVPNLILQPLVENAVRYGIAPRVEGGKITIRASCSEGVLRLMVADNGQGRARGKEQSGTGLGLSNVRSRLAELYGSDQSLDIHEPADGGFRVELRFPMHTETPVPIVAQR